MTQFWVYAALLTAVALAFLVTPLVRNRARAGAPISRAVANLTVFRDQLAELDADLAAGAIGREQWEAARGDLQRGLLEDAGVPAAGAAAPVKRSKSMAIAVGIAVPLASVLLYLGVGNPHALDPRKESAAQGAPHQLEQKQIESMVARLVQRLETNPDDGEGWVMLARTYSALGRYGDAAGAYARAEVMFPKNAKLLADYADTLAMAQGQSLQGKPEALVQRALQADGNNLKALALAGTVEFEKSDFAKAIEYWQRMLPLLPPDSEMGNSVRASIQEAQDKLGGAPKSSVPIAPEQQGGAPKSSTARVSKSGNVVPQRGDLEGVSKPLPPGTNGIIVVIKSEIQ
ncbi:MAG: c-type cytochrome biogenesis protein CcmI [Pseudomonadota bacterium]